MMTEMSRTDPAKAQLDDLLEDVCAALQLTPTQYREAEQRYRAVGVWLAAPQGPLSELDPRIYAQGSMALETTVRPRDRDEFDLDFVLQVRPTSDLPAVLYEKVYRRLLENEDYAGRIERLKRCIRLNYAHQFHVDILPARADRVRGGTCIEVPDRRLDRWMPSNPLGFKAWFEDCCTKGVLVEKAAQDPLPPNTPATLKPVLKRVVQLMKRHRDIKFADDDEAPRSVVLTTLAGELYNGEDSMSDALIATLKGIVGAIEASYPAPIIVVNPTNPAEHFSESWLEETYRRFADFIYGFQADTEVLAASRGLEEIGRRLNAMFGEEVGVRVVKRYVERLTKARDGGSLGYTAVGLTTMAPARPVPRHTFYGG